MRNVLTTRKIHVYKQLVKKPFRICFRIYEGHIHLGLTQIDSFAPTTNTKLKSNKTLWYRIRNFPDDQGHPKNLRLSIAFCNVFMSIFVFTLLSIRSQHIVPMEFQSFPKHFAENCLKFCLLFSQTCPKGSKQAVLCLYWHRIISTGSSKNMIPCQISEVQRSLH